MTWSKVVFCIVLGVLFAALAHIIVHAGQIPDDTLTPGKWRLLFESDVCSTKWGKDHRHVTSAIKSEVYKRYGATNHEGICTGKQGCEIDHRFPRELGGDDVIENLWVEPYAGKCNAHNKDRLENYAHRAVCNGTLTLSQARAFFEGDWREPYRKLFGAC